jgi:uncharacterized protein
VAGAERTWRLATAALLLAAGSSGAVPPPPLQIAADCERPTYASDQRVCSEPALLALDQQGRDVWLALVASSTAQQASAWLETQDVWFRRRSRCAFSERHSACLHAAYTERAAVLEAWRLAATTAGEAEAYRCTGAPWGAALVWLHHQHAGLLTISDASGRLLAIAVADAARDDWQPFLRFTAGGLDFGLQPLAGPGAVCTPA